MNSIDLDKSLADLDRRIIEQNLRIQMKHTSGPWLFAEDTEDTLAVHTVVAINIYQVSPDHLDGHLASVGALGQSKDQIEANARLIAAAPDLLEALEMARTIVACYPRNASDLARIDSAIAKARGAS